MLSSLPARRARPVTSVERLVGDAKLRPDVTPGESRPMRIPDRPGCGQLCLGCQLYQQPGPLDMVSFFCCLTGETDEVILELSRSWDGHWLRPRLTAGTRLVVVEEPELASGLSQGVAGPGRAPLAARRRPRRDRSG